MTGSAHGRKQKRYIAVVTNGAPTCRPGNPVRDDGSHRVVDGSGDPTGPQSLTPCASTIVTWRYGHRALRCIAQRSVSVAGAPACDHIFACQAPRPPRERLRKNFVSPSVSFASLRTNQRTIGHASTTLTERHRKELVLSFCQKYGIVPTRPPPSRSTRKSSQALGPGTP